MAVEWTGLGPDLLLHVDRGRPERLGRQLQDEFRQAIRSGRLTAGERVPSSRLLARDLGVSRGLVIECYRQLEAEGYLSTRVGSATRVALDAAATPDVDTRTAPARPLDVDFRYGVPDLTSFPTRDWLWALSEAARTLPTSGMGYGDPRGDAHLRTVLSAYLRRVRGAAADPDRLVICSGFAQGIGLVLRLVAAQGARAVALEDPGDRDNDGIARRAGLLPVPTRVDALGLDVGALAAADAQAALLTPAHQTPTGVVLAPERRQDLVAWAQRTGGLIIEDDYDAEFRYDRRPVGSLQGLAPDAVVTLGSVSKSLAPALRLGWIVCPPRLIHAVTAEKEAADRGSPVLDQLALARLIESGRYDRHLRRMRAAYAGRRQALIRALATYAPRVRLGGLAAGFHAVARLPTPADPEAIVAAARDRGIGIYPISRYRSGTSPGPPDLVIGFGNVSEDAIVRGIAAIGDLLDSRRTAPR